MFQDLDTALLNLFPDPASAGFQLLRGAEKSFITPDKNFTPQQNTVDLFLYDVKENRDFRDPTPLLRKNGAAYTRQASPLRIDCSYIVTAWSDQTDDAGVALEHQLLAEALQWLSQFPTIPPGALVGTSLANPIYPLPTMAAQLDPNKNAGDFWIALGIPPRPAFYLTVTIEMMLGLPVEGQLVSTHSTSTGSQAGAGVDTLIHIGGFVRATTGEALTGATVDLVDLGLRTTTDDDGRYSFRTVPAGSYALRTVAVGYRVGNTTLTVPCPPEDYDVLLDPL